MQKIIIGINVAAIADKPISIVPDLTSHTKSQIMPIIATAAIKNAPLITTA